jgi:hypothetical protein
MITQDDINFVGKIFCLPCTLLLNFGLFQFLLFVFHKRRREPSIRLMLGVAFISFACLVPGAHPDHDLVRNLSDISEVCSVLSFLLQITVLTRDVNKKFKIPTMAKLARVAELLVVLSFGVLLVNVVDIATSTVDFKTVELLDAIVEYISLFFVVGFRFYFLAMARGGAKVWKSQKLEVLFYVMFATHAVPFQIIDHATGLNWHIVQGLWMRCTIALCLSSTIRARLSSISSKASMMGTAHSKGKDNTASEMSTSSKTQPSKGRRKPIETGPSSKTLVTMDTGTKLASVYPAPTSKWVVNVKSRE